MDIEGKIIAALEPRSGTSARGEWKAQTFVIETQDQYPRKMAFDVFGADRLAQFAINVGDNLRVSFDIDAHEYNGRWFNNIRAFSVMMRSRKLLPRGIYLPSRKINWNEIL